MIHRSRIKWNQTGNEIAAEKINQSIIKSMYFVFNICCIYTIWPKIYGRFSSQCLRTFDWPCMKWSSIIWCNFQVSTYFWPYGVFGIWFDWFLDYVRHSADSAEFHSKQILLWCQFDLCGSITGSAKEQIKYWLTDELGSLQNHILYTEYWYTKFILDVGSSLTNMSWQPPHLHKESEMYFEETQK